MEVTEVPEGKIPNVDFDFDKAATEFNNAIREAAYVAVGLGVLGFQRAQVQRVELAKQLQAQLEHLTSLSGSFSSQLESYVETARERFSRLSADLPEPTAFRGQLTELAKAVDEAVAPVRQQLEEQFDRVEERLPETARGLVHSLRSAAAEQQQAFRSAVGLV